jgi:hypothetical protein
MTGLRRCEIDRGHECSVRYSKLVVRQGSPSLPLTVNGSVIASAAGSMAHQPTGEAAHGPSFPLS